MTKSIFTAVRSKKKKNTLTKADKFKPDWKPIRFVSDIRRSICMTRCRLRSQVFAAFLIIWLRGGTQKERVYFIWKKKKEKRKASCPLGKQTECDQDVSGAAGTSFEDKTEQWTIWIMYCSTRMTENKHCPSRCSCHEWISWLHSEEPRKAVSSGETQSPRRSQNMT